MASVYNRSGILWIAFYRNGKQIRKSANLPDTKENRKRIEKELLPKLEQAELNPNSKTFAYYKASFLQSKEPLVKEYTFKKYVYICEAFEPFFKTKITDIKASELRRFMSSLKVSAKTFRNYLSVLTGIFKEAIYDDTITRNPCLSIELPKLKKPDIELFNKAEIASLTNKDSWIDNLLGIAFFAGVRTGELIALHWKDISFEHRQIRVEHNWIDGKLSDCKTDGSRRTIPMFDEVYFFLQRQYLLTGLRNGYVFISSNGEPFTHTDSLTKHWTRHCRERDVVHKILYNTRHTFIVNLLESGAFSVMDIARIVGHTNTQMIFTRYAKWVKSEKKEYDLSAFKHILNTQTA